MSRFIIFIAASILLPACDKTSDDVSGNEKITGKILIRNKWDEEQNVPFGKDTIYIKKSADTTSNGYMFFTTTDGNGFFKFTNLNTIQPYILFAETRRNTRLDQNILFTVKKVERKASTENIELFIEPDTLTQNGLFVICQDVNGGRLPGDSVYIYTSKILAENDSSKIIGSGSYSSFITTNNGTSLKLNLPFNKGLYFNTARTFGSLRLKSQIDFKQLRAYGIDTLYVTLK